MYLTPSWQQYSFQNLRKYFKSDIHHSHLQHYDFSKWRCRATFYNNACDMWIASGANFNIVFLIIILRSVVDQRNFFLEYIRVPKMVMAELVFSKKNQRTCVETQTSLTHRGVQQLLNKEKLMFHILYTGFGIVIPLSPECQWMQTWCDGAAIACAPCLHALASVLHPLNLSTSYCLL